jgi:hypothetical protein
MICTSFNRETLYFRSKFILQPRLIMTLFLEIGLS